MTGTVVRNMASISLAGHGLGWYNILRLNFGNLGISKADMAVLAISAILLSLAKYLGLKNKDFAVLLNKPVIYRWSVYLLLAMSVICFAQTQSVPFLYFKF